MSRNVILLLMIGAAASMFPVCSNQERSPRTVVVETAADPHALPWEVKIIKRRRALAEEEHGSERYATIDMGGPGQLGMYAIANSWRPRDTLTAVIFFASPTDPQALAHINIRTTRIVSDLPFDFGHDGVTDLAVTYVFRDTLWLEVVNAFKGSIARQFLATGLDRDQSGYWDGSGEILDTFDVNSDGNVELFVACDVGYDLYPRRLMCVDPAAGTILWHFDYAGILAGPTFAVERLTPTDPPRIVFGINSMGNRAVTETMDDLHSYAVMLTLNGELIWRAVCGETFTGGLPTIIDYDDDGHLDILLPRRYRDFPAPDDTAASDGTVLEVFSHDGTLLDSLDLGRGYLMISIRKGDLEADGVDEIYLPFTNGILRVYDQHLRMIAQARLSAQPTIWGIRDYLGTGENQLLVTTDDDVLWVLSRRFTPLVQWPVQERLREHLSSCYEAETSAEGLNMILAGDGGRVHYFVTFGRTHWATVFSRHPSLAFLLAFAPMAVIMGLILVNWHRTREKNRIISEQRDRLDATLKDLGEAQKDLVAVEKYRKAQKALLASEENFRNLAEHSQQGLVVTQNDRVVFANHRLVQILGVSVDDLLGATTDVIIDHFIGSEQRAAIRGVIRADADLPAAAYGTQATEATVLSADGVERWLELYIQPVPYNGSPALLGVVIDISNRKTTELALKESEERYRSLVESATESIFTISRDGRFLYMNSVALVAMGLDADEMYGKSMHDFFPVAMADSQMQHVKDVFETGRGKLVDIETVVGGSRGWYRVSLEPIRDAQGMITSVLGIARDITPLIQTQSDLRTERDFVRSLLDTANSLILCLDNKARVTVFNEECERVTGYSREEVIGKWWPGLGLPQSSIHEGLKGFDAWVRRHPSDKYEGPLKTKSGEIRTILWSNSTLFSKDSDDFTAIAVGQDITEIKKVQEALRQSEERFRTVIDSSKDAMIVIDQDGAVSVFNRAAEKMFGWSAREMIGSQLDCLMPDEYRQRHRRYVMSFFEQGEPSGAIGRTIELPALHSNNTVFPVELSLSVGRHGEEKFVLAVIRDIRERKQSQEALSQSEERFRNLADMLPQSVLEMDTKGDFIYANRVAFESTGYSPEDLAEGINALALIVPEQRERARQSIGTVLAGGEPEDHEYIMLRKDGTTFPALIYSSRIVHRGAVTGIRGIVLDITERKRAEENLRASEEKMRAQYRGFPVPTYTWQYEDGNFVLIDCNDAAQEASTGKITQFLGTKASDFHGHEPHLLERLHACHRQRNNIRLETSYQFKATGQVRLLDVTLAFVPPDLVMVHTEDVTDKRAAEAALRQSEARTRAMVEATPIPMIITRYPDGDILYVNDPMSRLVGQTTDRPVGGNAQRYYANPAARETLIRTIEAQGHIDNFEFQVRRDDGTSVWVAVSSRLMTFAGQPALISGIYDLTERKQAEEALEHRVRFEELITTISNRFINLESDQFQGEIELALRQIGEFTAVDISYVVLLSDDSHDLRSVYRWHGPKAESLLAQAPPGYALDSLPWANRLMRGHKNIEIPDTAELPAEASAEKDLLDRLGLAALVQVPLGYRGEIVGAMGLASLSGPRIWRQDTIPLLTVVGEILANAYAHGQATSALEEAHRVRYTQLRQLAGGVAHEIHNALFPAASSLVKLAERIQLTGAEEIARNEVLLKLTDRAIQRAMKTTELVTGFSRLESQKLDQHISLWEVVQRVIDDNRLQIEEANIDISTDVPDSHRIVCNADHAYTLVNNLVLNAVEALADASERRIRVSSSQHSSDRIRIEVEDSGAGIPGESLPRIFDPFFSTKPHGGTGLGLALVREIAQLYGGTSQVESKLDKGTIFIIFLPEAK